MAGGSSRPPSSSSSSNAGRQSSIMSYFAKAEPSSSSRTSTPVHLPPVRPDPVASGSDSRIASTSDDASSATKAKSESPATPSVQRKGSVAIASGSNSTTKPNPRKTSPLKESTSARSLASSARKISFTEVTAEATTTLSDSSNDMEIAFSPKKPSSPIKRDIKGKGKALEAIQLSTTDEDEDEDEDEDDIVEDSQDPFAFFMPNDSRNPPPSPVKTSPRIPAVASEAFYSPSKKADPSQPASPSKIGSSPTKGVSPRADTATSAVSSPASISSRRSGRAAAALTRQNIYRSFHSPYGADMDAFLQQPPELSNSRSRQSTPRASARASRSTSAVPHSGTKLTKEALASLSPDPSTPPRTPRRDTASASGRYLREPSGSPLSSLAPTPKKSKTLKSARRPVAKPNFYFDFLVETKKRREPVIRRERSLTAPELDMEGSDDSEMEMDQDDGVTEKGSPKKRKQDDIGGNGNLSDSASSSSSSDSADESDDAGLSLALARAKARREGGTALLPTSSTGHPSSSTAVVPTSPDIRRSSRGAAKDEEKAKQQALEKQAKEKAKMKADMGLMDFHKGAQGRLGIAALQRERLDRERTGKSADWLEAAKLLAEEGEDEYDSDASSIAEDQTLTLDTVKLEDLVSAAANVVGDPDEEYADFAGSPQKREAKQEALRRANDIATTLKLDVGRSTRETSGEVEDRQARCFWREEANVVAWEDKAGSGEWSRKIETVIADGLKDSKRFPPSVTLFSRLKGQGTPEERTAISKRLLSLVCHPFTSPDLVNRANALLNRLIMHASLSSPPATLFHAAEIHAELHKLGARTELLVLPDNEAEVDIVMNESDEDDDVVILGLGLSTSGQKAAKKMKRSISAEERKEATVRLLCVVQGVAGSEPALFNSDDIVSLVVVCSRLALDPTAAPIRNAIETTLKTLLRTLELSDSSTLCKLYEGLVAAHHQSKPQFQLELLRALPQSSKSCKVLRRWLGWSFLVDHSSAVVVVATPDIFNGPPPLSTFQALLETHGDGPFKIVAGMDDSALYYHALTLTIALTDLTDELYAEGGKGKEARLSVDRIAKALAMVEGRIRSDIRTSDPMRNRAKNALTRLSHAFTYQVRTANGKTSGFDFSAEEGGDSGGATRGKPRARVAGGGEQTTLNFAPVAGSLTA